MAPDVTAEEAFRLARAMTLKNSAAGLPHGGGKAVIMGDPRMPPAEKELWIRAFARAIEGVTDYIPGPDMGTNEEAMAWMHDEIGRVVGLPREIGGIPLDEIGATGWGLSEAIEVACAHLDLPLKGARVAIQGFGAVGKHAARFLARRGAVLVAVSDSRGTVSLPEGLDVDALITHKNRGLSVVDYPRGKKGAAEDIVGVECEIWVPAARPDVLHQDNVHQVRAKLVAPGANIPCTMEAERLLHERNILLLPDFIANAGGVICAAVEFHGGSESSAFGVISEKIRPNVQAVLEEASTRGVPPRVAALDMARRRVLAAMRLRRFGKTLPRSQQDEAQAWAAA